MSDKVKVIHDEDKVVDTIGDMCARLGQMMAVPPTDGYGDGYDIVHILANYEDWDTGDQKIDQAKPFQLETVHVESWDAITEMLDRMLHDPEGMTQGFLILRR